MSQLMVCGKIYICVKCEKQMRVEYKGGAMLTQIGDVNVSRQLDLSDEFGQPNADPKVDGYYLYDFGTCHECYKASLSDEEFATGELLYWLDGRITQARQQCIVSMNAVYQKLIRQKAESLNEEDIGSATGEKFDKNFGDPHILESNRPKQLENFSKMHGQILEWNICNFAWSQSELQELRSAFNERAAPLLDELNSAASKIKKMYFPKQINQPENLNSFFSYKATIREPIEEMPGERIYYESADDDDDDDDEEEEEEAMIAGVENIEIVRHDLECDYEELQGLISKRLEVLFGIKQ